MKLPIEKILPIALCIVFPALNAITTRGIINIFDVDSLILLRWASVSAMLYLLWILLDYISRKAETYRFLKSIIAATALLIIVYNIFLLTPLFQNKNLKWMFVVRYFIAIIPFLIIQYAFRANKKVAQLELEKQQIQTENYKVQLEALRTKADPHFLFNSLNTLRTMVRHRDPKSEQFILSLSDFYRQTLRYNESTLIKLIDEVKVLESYLFLMKNRNEEAVQISIQIAEELYEHQIPTLALQTVVENCFKHNMMTSKMPLYIEIKSADNYIEIKNNVQPRMTNSSSSGYGLENLKKRYELLNIENGVDIESTDGYFLVRLKLI
ncbi:MAG: putative signal transduction histidine kinase [Chryseobacterium sp.]|jgi:sensor histidine kinase YesM|uniref:sensor histidine kinase n=1 Tax=Chryseobacterium sp. TaxID=1871047 RepID=UPI0026122A04|nr:histidine kinase [Chryseobacterium sp.]MDF2551066.1 putative signal transduction histidine kinase [Chryseobacterium sp.]